ncbi:MAG: O-antigen ligase domain-containing protein [Leptolyngbyaceae cyanobacterium bins.349]|nr:O-antigen ligase domain-containing protein [Leptolyngbyaceae cyanobacterium bins.349]
MKGLHLLKPTSAWTAILLLILFTALCLLIGAGSLLRFIFPVASFIVGLFLFQRYPILYLGFNWWIWFLTAWIARVADYRSGWDPQRLMLVAPFLVTLISGISLIRHLPKSYSNGGLPFILAFIAILYSFLIGLVQYSPFVVFRALLDWLIPVVFGFHLFINWREYPSYRKNFEHTFLWGTLVIGTYGVIQYLIAPEWDRLWITSTGLVSFGTPEPLGIRVFSTLHSTGPFASVIMAGLLLLFHGGGFIRFAAAGTGYLSLLLSLARTAWGSWAVAVLIHLTSLKSNLQMRFILIIMVMVICVLPLATVEPFSEIISSRLQTFSDLENDASFGARTEIYEEGLALAFSQGLGNGLGSITRQEVIDSGIIEMLMTLGWAGTLPYMAGIGLLLFSVFNSSVGQFDPFVSIARAIGLTSILQLIIYGSMLGISGMILWGFLGMAMAAQKYYQNQRNG